MSHSNRLENHSNINTLLRYWDIICIVSILLVIAKLRFPFLEVPLERDEGAFAYMAQLLLKGVPPYTEAYSLYFPGIFIIYALTFFIFGQTIFSIHFCLLAVNLITIFVIFLIGKKLFDSITGIISGASLGLLGLNPHVQGLFSHGEAFTMLFICSGLYILLLAIDTKKRSLFIWSGLCFGLGLLVKQSVFVFFGFPAVYLLLIFFKNFYQRRDFWFKVLLFFTLGYFIPLAIFMTFCIINGSLKHFLFWTFIMPTEMTPSISILRITDHFRILSVRIFESSSVLFLASVIGFLSPLWDKTSRSSTNIIILFWLFSFFTMCVSFYLRAHYFIYLFPSIALFIGISFFSINKLIKKSPLKKINRLITTGLILIFFSYSIIDQKKFIFQTNPEKVSRIIYGGNPFPESLTIADYIKRHSVPGDKIAILGSEPQILFYANRTSASKHIFTYYLMGNHQYALTMQKEAIKDIELAKPPILINVVIPTSWLFQKDSKSILFDWLGRFVSKYYELAGIVEIQDASTTNYYWGKDLTKFAPKGENFIQIYQRNKNL